MRAAARLNELLAESEPGLDRVLAVIASVDAVTPPTEGAVMRRLDELAETCPDDPEPGTVLWHMFETLGFVGDRKDYYDPANSLIHRTLHRRRGIPLTLAAIAAEIGRRRGIDLRPIGMPGHVLVGQGPTPSRWFDPFDNGVELDLEDCRLLFARIHPIEAFEPSMLQPMTPEAVAIRTLNNLRVAYTRRGDASRLVPVMQLRVGMDSAEVGDRIELAGLLALLGRFDQAAEQYQILIEIDERRADRYRPELDACLAHRN